MKLHDIPVLSGATRLGHLGELRGDRLGLFRRMNRERGDVARILALGSSSVFVNSPELLHEVLVAKTKHFVKPASLRGPLLSLAGDGLFTSDGELWRRQRKLMAPLLAHAEIARYAEVMAACAEEAAAGLRPGEALDAARLTTHIAMRIAGKALFDAETTDEADELGAALTVALGWANEAIGKWWYSAQLLLATGAYDLVERLSPALGARAKPYWDAATEPVHWPGEKSRRYEEAIAVIDRRVARMIEDRRASGLARRDLLSLLLSARDDDGGSMSDKQTRDEIVTLFIAGHETTASALAWALYLLARHPEAHARARAEAEALRGRSATAADLERLGFCLQVFKEALRLYPPVYMFGRRVLTDVRIGGYDLPRSTLVLISPWSLHRRPELWPDPERFDPARFSPAAEQARHKHAYLPFGGGPRICIGNHFALMEGPIVLATLLARADLELAPSTTVEPELFATLRPKGGVPMRVTAVRAGPRPAGEARAA
jgi:cytochrome P450